MNLKKEPTNLLKFWEIKHEIVHRLMANVDPAKLSNREPADLRHELRVVVEKICEALNQTFDPVTKDLLANEVFEEMFRKRLSKDSD
jgi:hypothetical protein